MQTAQPGPQDGILHPDDGFNLPSKIFLPLFSGNTEASNTSRCCGAASPSTNLPGFCLRLYVQIGWGENTNVNCGLPKCGRFVGTFFSLAAIACSIVIVSWVGLALSQVFRRSCNRSKAR